MPAIHVQRSIEINATAEEVFDTVADYSTWERWSPWLGIDKQANVTISDDPRSVGSVYCWQGDVVGQGQIEHLGLDRPKLISDELRILKPFRSRSDVSFTFEQQPVGTKITWTMKGQLPWFLFWMKSSMEGFIGMDYERGLKMLREFIETKTVLSTTDVVGVETLAMMDVYGVRASCPTNDVGPTMNGAFAQATSKLATAGIATDTEMVSIYHACDMKNRRFEFSSGFTVSTVGAKPDGIVHCRLPAGRFLHIRHTGSYENLGNAWSGAHQYARYKKLKLAKGDAFEIYRNSPETTATEDLITDIYLPLR